MSPTHREEAAGSGYVVDTLWSARIAIGFGNDTDTTAAVTGGIAGIRYGLYGIPQAWREALRGQELLTRFAARIGRTSRNREGTHISDYLMHRYNQIRPHQFNDGLPPAIAEKT